MRPWSGEDQAGHQVHQRGLAGAVRPDQAGDAGRDVQRDAVHAEHLAVELRDLVEARPVGRAVTTTTSTGRSLRSITRTSSRIDRRQRHSRCHRHPGPRAASTPSSAHQTWLTAQAGSMMCPQFTRSTLSIISATPAQDEEEGQAHRGRDDAPLHVRGTGHRDQAQDQQPDQEPGDHAGAERPVRHGTTSRRPVPPAARTGSGPEST